jgi:hypothetical protein
MGRDKRRLVQAACPDIRQDGLTLLAQHLLMVAAIMDRFLNRLHWHVVIVRHFFRSAGFWPNSGPVEEFRAELAPPHEQLAVG